MKCDECGQNVGHEIWCCLSRQAAPAPAAKEIWIGLTAAGMTRRYTFPIGTEANLVLDYANREARRDFVAAVVSVSMEVA